MTYPLVPFRAGAKLTKTRLDAAFSIERVAEAPLDQQVATSTTLVNSTYLVLSVAANSIYIMDMLLIYDGDAAADIKFDWTVPAGSGFRKSTWSSNTAAAANDATIFHGADDLLTGSAGIVGASFMTARPSGILFTAGTAGNFQFRFAQVVSSTATRIKAGSWMRLTKVA